MNNLNKLIKNLDEWILQSNHLKLRAERKLLTYANMPIKKFSNSSLEKAAGYVRTPPSVSLDNLRLLYAALGVKKILLNKEGGQELLGNAAGYLFLSFKTQAIAFEKGIVERCSILKDWASIAFFLIACCNDKKKINEMAFYIKKLNDSGDLRDPGSKVAIFCISLIEAMQNTPNNSLKYFEGISSDFLDTNNILDIYKQMVEGFSSETPLNKYSNLIKLALEGHFREACQSENNNEYFDFSWEPWSIFPCEVIGYAYIVYKKFGISIDFPESPLGKICRTFSQKIPLVIYDDIASQVNQRAEKVLFD